MNCLLNELVKNPAVESLLRKESSLGNLSLTEEALLYKAAKSIGEGPWKMFQDIMITELYK